MVENSPTTFMICVFDIGADNRKIKPKLDNAFSNS